MMEKVLKRGKEKCANKSLNRKLKVHKVCRIIMFRIIEGMFVMLGATIVALIVGCLLVPNVSFSMATSAGITQGTDFYTASALWLMPSLFFTLLIAAGTFCVLRRAIGRLHKFFSGVIERGNAKDLEEMVQ